MIVKADLKSAVVFGAGFALGVALGGWVLDRLKMLTTARM